MEVWNIDNMNKGINKEMTNNNKNKHLGSILKQQRAMIPLTLQALATKSGVSPSHLARIERGGRFPSASVLQRIARPLGFEESELLALAGYLSLQPSLVDEIIAESYVKRLDPIVARILAQEPVEVQHAVIVVLTVLKNIAKSSS